MAPRGWLLSLILLTLFMMVLAGATPAAAQSTQPAEQGTQAAALIALADLPAEQVDAKGWSEPVKVDGKSVRTANAGKDAWVQAKPWWSGGARPAEGQYWMIEVSYKDTTREPIIVSAFGNLAKYGSRNELHRFGGLNDGKWKTARIPVGADMIMARPVSNLVEFSIKSADGDVPVASIRVTPLGKEQVTKAAAQYDAETREWVAPCTGTQDE